MLFDVVVVVVLVLVGVYNYLNLFLAPRSPVRLTLSFFARNGRDFAASFLQGWVRLFLLVVCVSDSGAGIFQM